VAAPGAESAVSDSLVTDCDGQLVIYLLRLVVLFVVILDKDTHVHPMP